MKLETDTRLFDSSGTFQTDAFSIAASSKAFQILSDQLYTDKPRAILRELATNALDAHIAAGKSDEPFTVQLPTIFDTTLIVKDNGTGMTPEQIKHLYTTYFGSDKTHTNDLVGGLGLGSKSPFAYTDQFTAISRYNGVRYTYAAYINASGIPEISLIKEESTEECNGFEVHVPVKRADISTFESTARRVFQHFQIKPDLNVKLHFENEDAPVLEMEWNGIKANLHAGKYETLIMQGPIAYPVDVNALRDAMKNNTSDGVDPRILSFFRTGWRIHAPVGTFEITASRESLSYTKKTIDALLQFSTDIRDQLRAKTLTKLSAVTDIATAYDLLSTTSKYLPSNTLSQIQWRGLTWSGNNVGFHIPVPTNLEIRHVVKKEWGRFKDKKNSLDVRINNINFYLKQGKLRLFWSEKLRPYKKFIEDNDLWPGKSEAILYVTGPKVEFDNWRKRLGLTDFAEVPKVEKSKKSSPPTKGKRLGATEYQIAAIDGISFNSVRYTADVIRDENAPVLIVSNYGQLIEARDKLCDLHNVGAINYDHPMFITEISPSHTRVRKALLNEPQITDDQEVFFKAYMTSLEDIRASYHEACQANVAFNTFVTDTGIEHYNRIIHGAVIKHPGAQAFFNDLDALKKLSLTRHNHARVVEIIRKFNFSSIAITESEVLAMRETQDLLTKLCTEGAPYIKAVREACAAYQNAHFYGEFSKSPLQTIVVEWMESNFLVPNSTPNQEAA